MAYNKRQGLGLPFSRLNVGRAVIEVNGSLFEDSDTFNTGDVRPQNLFGSLLDDSDAFRGAVVDAPAPGNQSIIRSTFLNSSSLFHGIVRPTNLFGSLLEDSDTLNDGEIGGSRQLEGHDHNNESILFHGRLLLDLQELDSSLFSDADTLHHGALSSGNINISGSKLGDSLQVIDTSVSTNTATMAHAIDLPDRSNVVGRLVLVCIATDGTPSFTWPSGWTELFDNSASLVALSVGYRVIDGTEGFSGSGDEITVTTSVSEPSTSVSYLVENFDSSTIEINSAATGTSTNPDSGSITPSAGYDNYLFIAVHAHDVGTTTTTGFPSTYKNNLSTVAGGTGGVGIGASQLITPAETEDPGSFTISAFRNWIAATIAIRSSEVAYENIIYHGSMIPEIAGTILTDADTFYHGTIYKGVRLTSSQRNYTAGHENPGVYTLDNSNDWIAVTIAIR